MFQDVTPQMAIVQIVAGFTLGYFVPLQLLKWYIARLRRRYAAQRGSVQDGSRNQSGAHERVGAAAAVQAAQ